MKSIFLSDAKASIITFDLSNFTRADKRRAAVAVHADLSKVSYGQDSESLFFELDTIEPANDDVRNPMFNVSFFDAKNNKVWLRIPVQFLALSFTLSAIELNHGGLPIIFFDSSKYPVMNPAKTHDLGETAFTLEFPELDDPRTADIAEILGTEFDAELTYPISGIPFDQVEDNRPSRDDITNQIVMTQTLNAVLSLLHGDTMVMWNISDIVDESEIEDFEGLSPLDHMLSMIPLIADINKKSPALKGAYSNDSIDGKQLTTYTHEEFNRLLNSAGLEEAYNKLDSKKSKTPAGSDPEHDKWVTNVKIWETLASKNWPREMDSISEYFASISKLEAIEEICTPELADENFVLEKIEQYGEFCTLLGFYVYIVQQSYKYGQIMNLPCPVADIAISWISDMCIVDNWWEITVSEDNLANYNTQNTADVIRYLTTQEDGAVSSPYMVNMFIWIANLFLENAPWVNMEQKDLEEAIDTLGYAGEAHQEVRKMLTTFHAAILEAVENVPEEGSVSTQDIALYGVRKLFSEANSSILGYAESLALAIPTLVEIDLQIDGIEKDTVDWETARRIRINETLENISEEVGRKVIASL